MLGRGAGKRCWEEVLGRSAGKKCWEEVTLCSCLHLGHTVTDRERGRAGRNASTDAATNAINAARENRARFSSGNLDPRVKSRVDPELLHDLKSKVKKLYRQLGLTLSHQVQLQREAVKKQCPHLYGFSPLL